MNTFTASRFDTGLAYPDEPYIHDVTAFLASKTRDSLIHQDEYYLAAFQDENVLKKLEDCRTAFEYSDKIRALEALNSAIYDYVHASHEEEYNESI